MKPHDLGGWLKDVKLIQINFDYIMVKEYP